MAMLSEGCETPQRRAARLKLSSSHIARKYWTCCISRAGTFTCTSVSPPGNLRSRSFVMPGLCLPVKKQMTGALGQGQQVGQFY
jgi:hypothetical protein